jgi:hypothetical protein
LWDATVVSIVDVDLSMGDHDFVKPLLEEFAKVVFGRVLMKPGKPMVFATYRPAGSRAEVRHCPRPLRFQLSPLSVSSFALSVPAPSPLPFFSFSLSLLHSCALALTLALPLALDATL